MIEIGIGISVSNTAQASAGGGGGALDSLFGGSDVGDYWNFTDTSKLFQDSAKTTAVTSNGDVVGAAVGERGSIDLLQTDTTDLCQWSDTLGLTTNNTKTDPHLKHVFASAIQAGGNNARGITIVCRMVNANLGVNRNCFGIYPSASTTCRFGFEQNSGNPDYVYGSGSYTDSGSYGDFVRGQIQVAGTDALSQKSYRGKTLLNTTGMPVSYSCTDLIIGDATAPTNAHSFTAMFFIDRELSTSEYESVVDWMQAL